MLHTHTYMWYLYQCFLFREHFASFRYLGFQSFYIMSVIQGVAAFLKRMIYVCMYVCMHAQRGCLESYPRKCQVAPCYIHIYVHVYARKHIYKFRALLPY